jgi:hypothetical protein
MTCPVSDDCTNITAFVSYEHFEGVSDLKMKPILHSIVPPSTTFCSSNLNPSILKSDLDKKIFSSFINDSKKFVAYKNGFDLEQIIVMRSGVWRKSNDVSNETRWKYDFIWNHQKHRVVYNNLRNFLIKNEIKVAFIGSSHMRENVDLMTESLRLDAGIKIGSDQNSSIYNGTSWGLKYEGTVLAKDQIKLLKNLCSTYEESDKIVSQKRVIVIKNGAWDLFESSLRVPVQDFKVGLSLIKIIADIVAGLKKCGNIYRVIYVTPAPHILCNRDGHWRCEYKRGYRTNFNLAALREFYLNNLYSEISGRILSHRNSSRSLLQAQLHIVDAFDIIRSRLICSDENYNTNHFLCNCQNFFYETPAGREVLNGIVFAISGSDLMSNITVPYKTYQPGFIPPGKCNCLS